MTQLIVGFDPGGTNATGWVIAKPHSGPRLEVRASGTASTGQLAVIAALSELRSADVVVAAGIDAPLFWSPNGDRAVDRMVRAGVRAAGAPSPGGTVQHVNSLRGACLVQGVIVATLLRRRFPRLLITETHPKALLWLLGIQGHKADSADWFLEGWKPGNEHERDAAISAWSANMGRSKAPGWRQLQRLERDAIAFMEPLPQYWMPIDHQELPIE